MTDFADLFEHAPCGYLSTDPHGRIAEINATLLNWLGYGRADVVGVLRFDDLLTAGGRIYHETHFAPLLRMQHQVGGLALELVAKDGTRLPVLVTSIVRTGADGSPESIRTAVFDARDRRAYEQELLRARLEADRERDRVEQLATTLQRTLLPPGMPDVPGLDVAAHYQPASRDQVGGDFYDLFPLADGRWALFLGDVCGKGAQAAAVTSLTRYTLRSAAVFDPEPATVLGNLDSVLRQERARFCTVLYGVLTPFDGGATLVLASGGHPPAVLLRADGTAEYLSTLGGQPAGLLPAPRFVTITVELSQGDTALLYTDGLTEARTGTARERYGENALLRFASDLAPASAHAVVTALTGLLAGFGDGMQDDAAILAVGVQASAASRVGKTDR